MNVVQIRRYQMLVRVRDFGNAHADLFPASGLGGQAFSAVAEAVTQLNAHTVAKLSSAQGTATTAKARAVLLDRIETIGRTGRVIVANTPGLEEKFVLPLTPSAQSLLMTARVYRSEAEPLRDRFIAHLLPETFLTDLDEAIRGFEEAIQTREAARDGRLAARSRIEAALTAGTTAAQALDAMVANRLRDDPATMAVWRRDRRVSYPTRSRASKGLPDALEAAAPAASTPEPAAAASPPSTAPAIAEVTS